MAISDRRLLNIVTHHRRARPENDVIDSMYLVQGTSQTKIEFQLAFWPRIFQILNMYYDSPLCFANNFFNTINEALQNMCFQVQPIQMMPPTQLILFDIITFWFVFVGFCYIPISFFHVIFGWGAPSAVHGNSNRCPKVTSWLEGLSFHDGGTGIISLKAIIHVCCHSFWWCKR